VCLRSCSRTAGRPARSRTPYQCRLRFRGSIGVPCTVVKTRPESTHAGPAVLSNWQPGSPSVNLQVVGEATAPIADGPLLSERGPTTMLARLWAPSASLSRT
jgi:hypothetical protein